MDRKSRLANICKDFSVSTAYLFGSQAEIGLDILNGQSVTVQDPLTDLDLGIVFQQGLPSPEELPRLYANIYNRITDLFSPLKLDLVLLQEQHSVFQANAITGICIYTKDEKFKGEYEENILRRAADFRPFLEKYLDEHLEGALK